MAKKLNKKILDVTCGSRTIWFDKNHPAAIYADKRAEELMGVWKSGNGQSERHCIVAPDIQCDFTDIPFGDNSFALVVFDPPHLRQVGENAWLAKKYGKLDDNWPEMLHAGFEECMRVLKPDGVLIFKWNEAQIPAAEVWKAIGQRPLFGHHSGKKSQTFWGCFMKFERNGDGIERPKAYEDTGLMPEELIYCRRCTNFRQNAHGVCWCDEYGGAITPEDYCSRAVRESEPPAR